MSLLGSKLHIFNGSILALTLSMMGRMAEATSHRDQLMEGETAGSGLAIMSYKVKAACLDLCLLLDCASFQRTSEPCNPVPTASPPTSRVRALVPA